MSSKQCIKTLKVRICDRHAPLLRAMAREVNFVWNYVNELSERRERALRQGMIAINSVLRDWIKGQLTAVESGIVRFDHIFLPYMLTHSGKTVGEVLDVERIAQLTYQPQHEGN